MNTAELPGERKRLEGPWRVAALLGLALLIMHAEVLTGGATFFHRDFGVIGYPTVFHHREAFWRGELPFWNPLSHGGVPFLAQWGTMVLYPGSLIYLLLPLPWSLNLFCVLHLWLGGVGMYRLARGWTHSELGAALAGLAFAGNGLTQACLLWPNYVAALGWVPWVLETTDTASRQGGRHVVTAALAMAAQYLTGAPELIALTWVTAAVAALAGAGRPTTPHAPVRTRGWPVAGIRVVSVGLLALGLTAMQTLPFLELLARSQRAEGVDPTQWAWPVSGLANLVLPLYQTVETTQGGWLHPDQQFLESVYLGAGLLTTASMAFVRRRSPRIWALLGLAAASCLLALGDQTPLEGWLRSWLPGFGLIRYPVKFLLLLSWVIPLLAAYGIRAVESEPERGRCLRIAGSVALLLLGVMAALSVADQQSRAGDATRGLLLLHALFRSSLFIAFLATAALYLRKRPSASRTWARLAVLALILADYLSHMPHLNPTLPTALLMPGTTEGRGLPSAAAGRVFITPEADARLLHSSLRDPAVDYVGKRLAEWSHLNLLDGVSKVNGAATLVPAWPGRLLAALQATTNAAKRPLLDFLGVTHVTSATNVTSWEPRAGAMPLASAGQRPIRAAPDELIPLLLSPDFAPRRTVFVDDSQPGPFPTGNATNVRVELMSLSAHRLRLRVNTDAPALVTVAQAWDPGWRVQIEGRERPLWQVNGGFQAFEIPTGNHEVELRYRSRPFQLGLGLAGISMACCGWVWRGDRANRRVGTRA